MFSLVTCEICSFIFYSSLIFEKTLNDWKAMGVNFQVQMYEKKYMLRKRWIKVVQKKEE